MTNMIRVVDLFRIIMLKCVDEGGEDEDAHGEEEGEHAKLFVAVLYWKLNGMDKVQNYTTSLTCFSKSLEGTGVPGQFEDSDDSEHLDYPYQSEHRL